jgi:dihydrofolate reductase
MRSFSLIVSCSENRVIGRDGRLPWRIAEDFEFFLRMTEGQVLVMGRVCFDSWPGAVRDGRRPVVVTSRPLSAPAAMAASSLEDALHLADGLAGDIFICGGQRIYEETISRPEANRLYLTLVHAAVSGDRFFPEWKSEFPREQARRDSADANWRYSFLTLGR